MKKLLPLFLTLALLGGLLFFQVSAETLQEGDFEYRVTDGKATITKYTGTGGAVTIPSTLGGYPVTSIEDVFRGCSSLTSVTIPDSITFISGLAFLGCTSLNYNIYDNAKYLGSNSNPYFALMGSVSKNITSCQIHPQTKIIGYEAFDGCSDLTSVTIPNKVVTIGVFAFSGCSSLTSVTIPDSVTSISSYAFSSCPNLTSVIIPDNSSTTIGVMAFHNSSSLNYSIYGNAKYLGNSNNPYMALISAVDNNISSCQIHADTKIISDAAFENCSSLTSITLPDGITGIGKAAFRGCTGLTSITIPDGITTVDESTFSGCTALKKITIPVSMFNFSHDAFKDVPLKTVHYAGTEEQWNKIDLNSNTCFATADIKFTQPEADPKQDNEETKGLPTMAIVLISCLATFLLGGGAMYLLMKKRK